MVLAFLWMLAAAWPAGADDALAPPCPDPTEAAKSLPLRQAGEMQRELRAVQRGVFNETGRPWYRIDLHFDEERGHPNQLVIRHGSSGDFPMPSLGSRQLARLLEASRKGLAQFEAALGQEARMMTFEKKAALLRAVAERLRGVTGSDTSEGGAKMVPEQVYRLLERSRPQTPKEAASDFRMMNHADLSGFLMELAKVMKMRVTLGGPLTPGSRGEGYPLFTAGDQGKKLLVFSNLPIGVTWRPPPKTFTPPPAPGMLLEPPPALPPPAPSIDVLNSLKVLNHDISQSRSLGAVAVTGSSSIAVTRSQRQASAVNSSTQSVEAAGGGMAVSVTTESYGSMRPGYATVAAKKSFGDALDVSVGQVTGLDRYRTIGVSHDVSFWNTQFTGDTTLYRMSNGVSRLGTAVNLDFTKFLKGGFNFGDPSNPYLSSTGTHLQWDWVVNALDHLSLGAFFHGAQIQHGGSRPSLLPSGMMPEGTRSGLEFHLTWTRSRNRGAP